MSPLRGGTSCPLTYSSERLQFLPWEGRGELLPGLSVAKEAVMGAMRWYAWEGADAHGARLTGRVQGRSPAYVRAGLLRQGIQVARVWPASEVGWRLPGRREGVDAPGFSRQLATLLKAGVPLLQAFEVMGRSGADAAMVALLGRVQQEVAAGLGLAEALQRQPCGFDGLYCNLVRVGEQSGTLDRQLEQLADMLERRQALKRRVRKAMLYPLILLLTGLAVAALLLLEVVPRFEGMFTGVGKELPVFTQWVIDVSDGLGRHLLMILTVLGITGVGCVQLYRGHLPTRLWMIRQALRLPMFGRLLSHAALARFARSLATAYGAGVALLDALHTVAPACGDALHERAVGQLRQGMANGLGLHQAMALEPLFAPLLVQLTAIGESSGTLDAMLDKAACHYEEQVGLVLEQLTSLLEPAIVLILGVLVGGLVVAMYLPIFQLGSLI